MLLLNLMVVASTLTTGWHYGTDVIGGILVAVTAAVATHRLRPSLQFVPPSYEISVAPRIPETTLTNTSARQTALQSRLSVEGEGNLQS